MAESWRDSESTAIIEHDGVTCVRLPGRGPLWMGFLAAAIVASIAWLVLVITLEWAGLAHVEHPPPWVAYATRASLLMTPVAALVAGSHRRSRIRNGALDLIIDPRAQTIDLPHESGREIIVWYSIAGVAVDVELTTGPDGGFEHARFVVLVCWGPPARRVSIWRCDDPVDAAGFRDWLARRLGKAVMT